MQPLKTQRFLTFLSTKMHLKLGRMASCHRVDLAMSLFTHSSLGAITSWKCKTSLHSTLRPGRGAQVPALCQAKAITRLKPLFSCFSCGGERLCRPFGMRIVRSELRISSYYHIRDGNPFGKGSKIRKTRKIRK